MPAPQTNRTVSLAAYSIAFKVSHKKEYFPLDTVTDQDAFDLLTSFLSDSMGQATDRENKAIFKTRSVDQHPESRTLSGTIETGEYGYSARGVNVETDSESYKRTVHDAEMVPLSYLITLPKTERCGLVILQRFGNIGISSQFIASIREYVRKRIPNVTLEFEALVHPSVVKAYSTRGKAKKIKFRQWLVPKDIADSLGCKLQPGDAYVEYSIIAKRSGALGSISKLLGQTSSKGDGLLGVPLPDGFTANDTLVEVDINGRSRMISLKDISSMNSFYDITTKVEFQMDGHPTPASVLIQSHDLAKDMFDLLKGARNV